MGVGLFTTLDEIYSLRNLVHNPRESDQGSDQQVIIIKFRATLFFCNCSIEQTKPRRMPTFVRRVLTTTPRAEGSRKKARRGWGSGARGSAAAVCVLSFLSHNSFSSNITQQAANG